MGASPQKLASEGTSPGLPDLVASRSAHLPFDQLQRFSVVARILERIVPPAPPTGTAPRPSVLDVGGDVGALADVFPCRLTVADRTPVAGGVRAEGQLLPFLPGSFDVVVSCDALEHVEPSARSSFLAELLRVSRRWVVLAAPFQGPDVMAAEVALHEILRGFRGGRYPFLAEHLERGLPDLDEVRRGLASFGAAVADLPNGYLPRWLPMMAVTFFLDADPRYAALRPIVARAYDRIFGPHDACEPCYRRILLADKEGVDPAPLLADLRSTPGAAPQVEPGYVLALLAELVHHAGGDVRSDAELLLAQVGHLAGKLRERERQLGDLEAAYRGLSVEEREGRAAREGAEAFARHLERALADERATLDAARRALGKTEADLAATKAEHARLEGFTRELQARVLEMEAAVRDGGPADLAGRIRAMEAESRERDRWAHSLEELAEAREEARLEAARSLEAVLQERSVLKAELERLGRERAERAAAAEAARVRADGLQAELALAGDRLEALRVHAENLAGIVERLSQRPVERLLRRLRG